MQALDVEPLANLALKTKLHKDHILASNEHIQRATSSYLSANAVVSPEPGTAEAKVHSRLLSSKVLASEISSAVDYLRKVLEPLSKKEAEGDPDKAVAYDAADSDDDTEENVVSIVPNPRKPAKVIAKSPTEAGEEEEGESGIEGVAEDDHDSWESGSVDSRGAADAGWESGTVDDSDAEEAEDDVEIGSEDNSSSSPRPAKKKMVKVMPKESTFLPSLAVGFTRGDSDTDWSDSEAKVADSTEKKNRRGQRARRAYVDNLCGRLCRSCSLSFLSVSGKRSSVRVQIMSRNNKKSWDQEAAQDLSTGRTLPNPLVGRVLGVQRKSHRVERGSLLRCDLRIIVAIPTRFPLENLDLLAARLPRIGEAYLGRLRTQQRYRRRTVHCTLHGKRSEGKKRNNTQAFCPLLGRRLNSRPECAPTYALPELKADMPSCHAIDEIRFNIVRLGCRKGCF